MTETPDLGRILLHYGVDVQTRSGNQQVRCFLHDETNPSCSVDLSRGLYHCFGCGAAGDAYTLIASKELHTDFKETLAKYEEITGSPVKRDRPQPKKPGQRGYRPRMRRRVV